MRQRQTASGLGLGLVVLGARVAEAHQAATHGSGPDGLAVSLAVAAVATLAVVLVPWRVTSQPKAPAVLLAVGFVTVLSLEAGIHSVHHLDSPEQAAKCEVLFVSKHLSGDCPDPPPRLEGPAEG
ncbi:MAG: hypothetical protein ACREMC_09325, partial [Gemmatimonadales bacterium]